jgi:hypothetical protein
MGLHYAAQEGLPKTWSMRNQTSRWLRTSKSVGPTVHLSNDRDDSQHPFGDQATAGVACPRRVSGVGMFCFRHAYTATLRKHATLIGPWFCVPALRLVCLFEDDDAAGPFNTELRFGPRRSGCNLTMMRSVRLRPDLRFGRGVSRGSCPFGHLPGADDSSSCLHRKPMSTAIEVKPRT